MPLAELPLAGFTSWVESAAPSLAGNPNSQLSCRARGQSAAAGGLFLCVCVCEGELSNVACHWVGCPEQKLMEQFLLL